MTTYNITEVGTLTNNNGVLSGFSSSDYAITPVTFNWGNNWELQIKFTYNSASRTQTLLSPEESDPYGSILIIPDSYNIFKVLLGSNNFSWDICNSSVFELSDGGTYWVKLSFDGSAYVCNYSTDGTTWTSTNLASTSTQLYGGLGLRLGLEGYGNSNPWTGSIDLNECYVKINGTTVWEGATVPTYTGTHIQLRHDTASNWSDVNPTLLEGEVGFETDTNRLKIGDGISAYNNLTNNIVTSLSIKDIKAMTQAQYDALTSTLYAWNYNNGEAFYYTKSSSVSAGDTVYSGNGTAIGTVGLVVDSDTIIVSVSGSNYRCDRDTTNDITLSPDPYTFYVIISGSNS